MVHFIGAGPGAEDLITVRGAKLLGEADVIIYAGSLVNPALLSYKKESCAEQGMAVVFISSEIEEMLRTCDRMVVMRDGTKVGELSNDEMNQSTIMSTIAGGQ